jgi:hypothetical protein
MPPFRYRDEESSSEKILLLATGALAGFAAGVLIAQRFGGLQGITSKLRETLNGAALEEADDADFFDEEEEEFEEEDEEFAASMSPEEELEDRVLEAYHNDPLLSSRAIDIGAIGEGIIELTGWVQTPEEAAHAVTVCRGTPGVETVVNRLAIRPEEETQRVNSRRYEAGEPELSERHWEGNQLGAGRPRHGTSQMEGRDPDTRAEVAERYMDEDAALRDRAEDVEGIAERRESTKRGRARGGRTDGSPVAPTGVPKADHVADPTAADDGPRAD